MDLMIVLALFVALDVAVWLWGHDSRDGQDWKGNLVDGSV
jgi:hypothetical protein